MFAKHIAWTELRLGEPGAYALVVPHKSAGADFCTGAEAIPGPGEVIHALQADPHRLGARLALGAFDIAAQAGDQMHLLGKTRGLLRRFLLMDRHPDRFPFRRLEDRLAIRVGALSAQAAHEQRPPSHDQVQRQARQHPLDILETPPLDATARLQSAEQQLDAPAYTVVLLSLIHI